MDDTSKTADPLNQSYLNAKKLLEERLGMTIEPIICLKGTPEEADMGGKEAHDYILMKLFDVCIEHRLAAVYEHSICKYDELQHTIADLYGCYPHVNTVLDMGCSVGFAVLSFLKSGYNAVGVDKNEDVVQAAKEHLKQHDEDPARIILADFTSPDFPGKELYGRTMSEYDAFFFHQPVEVYLEAMASIAKNMRPEQIIAAPQEDLFTKDERWDHRFDTDNFEKELKKIGIKRENLCVWSQYFRKITKTQQ